MVAKSGKLGEPSAALTSALAGTSTSKTKKDSGLPDRVDVSRLYVKPHLIPYEHQITAFLWALRNLKNKKSTYLGLKPGLGKTIIAAMLSNFRTDVTFFYVCPPFLTTNTSEEFSKWCFDKKLYLLPDSMIAREKTLRAFVEKIKETPKRVLIIDEAHRFKNETTQRGAALYKNILPHFGNKAIWMSGTPMPNKRAKELWPILRHTAPEIFGTDFFKYALKYCGAFRGDFGWNFDGFTNRAEFKARIQKSFMLRMGKEVLKLPPKIEGLLTVGEGIPPVISGLEKKILAQYSPEDLAFGQILKIKNVDDLHMMTYLRLLGEFKLKYVLPFIQSLLEETEENILIFAVHKETIKKLEKELGKYEPIVITGSVPKNKRQDLVKEYQTNSKRRVFIGNILACGMGFTLTKANRVLFVEFSWVDGDNEQASDRAHRIGQDQTVTVQYVVLKDSFDRQRMEVLLQKRSGNI